MATPPKNVGLKRPNDGGPANPTVLDKRYNLRNALAGAQANKSKKKAAITLPTLNFMKKDTGNEQA